MTITETNLNFITYFAMIIVLAIWICGFKTITLKGRIGHFIQRFFDKTFERKEYVTEKGNEIYDNEIVAEFFMADFKSRHTNDEQLLFLARAFLESRKIQVDYSHQEYIDKLMRDERNKYWFNKSIRRFPEWIAKPIIGCVVCMPSVHGMIVYSVISFYMHWNWNPFEWLFIAIPTAFVTEHWWKHRNLLDKKVNPQK